MSSIKKETSLPEDEASTAAKTADTSTIVWDEARLEAALKRLQELFCQVRELRSTMPKLIAPFISQQSSPEGMYRKLAQSIITANHDVKDLRELMEDDFSRDILEHAKQSRTQKGSKSIKPLRISDDPHWYEKKS